MSVAGRSSLKKWTSTLIKSARFQAIQEIALVRLKNV